MPDTSRSGDRALVIEEAEPPRDEEEGTFAGVRVPDAATAAAPPARPPPPAPATLPAPAAPPALATPPALAPALLVGDCIDDRHPHTRGRVLVRFRDASGAARERWLPTLQGLPVRTTDRVLVQQPANWPEPIVTGVVDGHAARPDIARVPAASIALKSDEALVVTTTEGAPLLEVRGSDEGPIVRLLREDVKIEAPGHLELSARSIALRAENGPVTIDASDDVAVKGEVIRLN